MGALIQGIKKIAKRKGIILDRYRPHLDKFRVLGELSQRHGVRHVIDVGANDGGFARDMFEAGYEGTVISVEPQAGPWQAIKDQAARNPHWRQWPRMCLGAANGEVEFNISANSVSSSVLPVLSESTQANSETRYVRTEKIPLYRLDGRVGEDEELSDPSLPFSLKLDVQGFEGAVLDGALGVLGRVPVIILEMSLVPLYEGSASFSELYGRLEALGYTCAGIYPGFTDTRTMRMLQVDGIFERKDFSRS